MRWQPTASLPALQQRATLLQQIRDFFQQRQVLEVDVPLISAYATIDPFIDSLQTSAMGQTAYLQTSPEFFLKRFLCAYPEQDVYSLGKAFRQGEKGGRHLPEFTMLEWYRTGWNEQQLIDEVIELLRACLSVQSSYCFSYADIFTEHLSINPHTASVRELAALCREHIDIDFAAEDKNPWLDLLMTHCIEPQLPDGLVAIYDYPASQAALARIASDEHGHQVAKRFEVYVNGMELANGYWELNDAVEQEARFKADLHYRQKNNLPALPYDQALLDAMSQGELPDCAGVALGVDRLLMCLLATKNIGDVVSFTQ